MRTCRTLIKLIIHKCGTHFVSLQLSFVTSKSNKPPLKWIIIDKQKEREKGCVGVDSWTIISENFQVWFLYIKFTNRFLRTWSFDLITNACMHFYSKSWFWISSPKKACLFVLTQLQNIERKLLENFHWFLVKVYFIMII